MRTATPPETLPQIGTVENPAYFSDGHRVWISYEIAPVEGGGQAVLMFDDVVKFVQNPQTVEGARNTHAYPITPWGVTEVFDSEETTAWHSHTFRFWTLSFNDVTIAITFRSVQLIRTDSAASSPAEALKKAL